MHTQAGEPPPGPTELSGAATGRRGRWLFTVYPVMAIGYLVMAIINRRPETATVAAIWTLAALATRLRSDIEVTRQRIRLGGIGRWRRTIAWESVAFVEKPARFDTVTALVLTDGRRIVLTSIPATQAGAVAAIGGAPLQAPVGPEVVDRLATVPRRPSVAEQERDLTRRSQALAAQRDRMTAELERLRAARPDR